MAERREVFRFPSPNAPDSQPPASGLQLSTPIPYCWQTGSRSASMPRARIEYWGCSVRNRSRPRRSATQCDSTTWWAGNVEQPA